MPERRRQEITNVTLEELLAQVDEVMAEARRLRDEVTRQMIERRENDQPRITRPRRTGRAR